MAAIEWIRFLAGAVFLLAGLAIFVIEMVGVFRFKYVLNRMHAAAMGDTLGIGFSLIGLIIMSGFTFTSLKLFLVIVFLWFSSPTSSHLIARLEVTTDEEPGEHYLRLTIDEVKERAAAQKDRAAAPESGEGSGEKLQKEAAVKGTAARVPSKSGEGPGEKPQKAPGKEPAAAEAKANPGKKSQKAARKAGKGRGE